MKNIIFRRAKVEDKNKIALLITNGFEEYFNILGKKKSKIVFAIEDSIQIEKFYVVEYQQQVIGTLALTDKLGRAITVDEKAYKKHFGFFKGIIASLLLKETFTRPLTNIEANGYIEFLTIEKQYRGKGIAHQFLKYVIKQEDYHTYIVDVTNTNTYAISCYQKTGFQEFRRVKEKHGRQKGFNERIYMKYE